MARLSARALAAVGMALVALVLAHSLVFLVRYGSVYGEALAHAGHGVAWTLAIVSAIGLGLGLGLAGIVQVGRLAREARARGAGAASEVAPSLVRRWLVASGQLAATTTVLLTIQENLERAGARLPTPGIGLLVSADYPGALAVVGLVGLTVGLVVALFQWRRDVLIARIRAARTFPRRSASAAIPTTFAPSPAASALGVALGLRAPPRPLAS